MTTSISSEQQLEDLLSQPREADRRAMAELEGDLLILGVGGKMGPSLARLARRASDEAGVKRRIIGVARFSSEGLREELEQSGIETVAADMLDQKQLDGLPDAPNVVYMAARKFGSTGNEPLTWAMNTYLPARVAERYRTAKIAAFSTGNVYPLVPVLHGGCTEDASLEAIGEYAQSALGRERMFQYFSGLHGTPVSILRLNYAIDLRYGVLLDIGMKVYERRPVNVSMGHVNVIWQGDANSVCLRSLALASSPPFMLNVTGPETIPVRWVAHRFGEHFGVEPILDGEESPTALLNNAARCHRLLGYPVVSIEQLVEWQALWIGMGGRTLNKPTHFETRDGKF